MPTALRTHRTIVTSSIRESPVDPGRGTRGAETIEITAGSVFGILSNLAATTLRHLETDRSMDPLWIILRFLLGLVWGGPGIVSDDSVLRPERGFGVPVRLGWALRPFRCADGMRVRPGLTWFGRPPECYCVAPVACFDQRGGQLDRFTTGLASRPPAPCRDSSAPASLLPRGG